MSMYIVLLQLLFIQYTYCLSLEIDSKVNKTNILSYNNSSINPNHGEFDMDRKPLKYSAEREPIKLLTERNEKIKNKVKRDAFKAFDLGSSSQIREVSVLNSQVTTSWSEEKAEHSPYSVILIVKTIEGLVFCTGTLLSLQWVLTAASCLLKARVLEVTIYAGGNALDEWLDDQVVKGSQVRKSSEHHCHPYYYMSGPFKTFFNVAVLKAVQVFRLSETVAPIELSTSHLSFARPTNCKITSFGRVNLPTTSKNYFRKMQRLSVETPCMCFDEKDTDYWICPKPHRSLSICKGDIGGGLICDGKIKAIMSQIIPARDARSCDISYPKYYDCFRVNNTLNVFQGTCPYLRFINQYVKLFPKNQIKSDCDFKPHETKSTSETPSGLGSQIALTNLRLLLSIIICLLLF